MPEPSRKVLITRDVEGPVDKARPGVAARHPEMAYVFGPTIRGLYVVGCMAIDLFGPLQILQLMPDQALVAFPLSILAFAGLAYLEYRAYRRLWPPPHRREVVDVAGRPRI